MKKRLQRITTVFLAGILLCSFTACRKNPKENTSGDLSSEPQNTESWSDDAVSEDASSEDAVSEDTSSADTSSKELPTISSVEPPVISFPSSVSSASEIEETAVAVDRNDKAYTANPASLSAPMSSKFDGQASTLRKKVLNTKDSLPSTVTGKIWYISNSGSDKNAGNSKNAAWATINAINFYGNQINAGDAVLFERGGVYRGTFNAKSGVYYGAYGSGDKPCIYGSDQNYQKVNWKKKFGNVWICDTYISDDVGTIVFNHGELIGYKRDKRYQMKNNGDFWCDGNNGYTLYVYMDKNPAKAFKSIEIGIRKSIITIGSNMKNITVENLCLKYTGAHAVDAGGGAKNITVKNCEIGFIGGSYLKDYWREGTRYGNAVQFWGRCENITVENNWIYQIYDSGITHQGDGEYVAKNIRFCGNLIEYCGMGSIEYWLWNTEDKKCRAENVTYADNIMRFAGYGWGGIQRPDKVSAHILSNGNNHNDITNFKITGNIFDQSSCDLIEISSLMKVYPLLSGNTYAQNAGGRLGTYAESKDVIFDENVKSVITNAIGDQTAVVLTY